MLSRTFLLLLCWFTFTIANAQQPSQAQPVQSPPTHTRAITYKITDAANHTFGYDVFVDGKLMIHQTSIPAMPGNNGFKTKGDAEKVAQLVIEKIKKGEMPPTVSVEEMKKLNVTK